VSMREFGIASWRIAKSTICSRTEVFNAQAPLGASAQRARRDLRSSRQNRLCDGTQWCPHHLATVSTTRHQPPMSPGAVPLRLPDVDETNMRAIVSFAIAAARARSAAAPDAFPLSAT